jgi:hypothetical protein
MKPKNPWRWKFALLMIAGGSSCITKEVVAPGRSGSSPLLIGIWIFTISINCFIVWNAVNWREPQ